MHSTHNKGKSIVDERFIRTLNLFSGWAFLRLLTDGGRQSGSPLSKIGKLHQQFFSGNQQFLLYQEIQIQITF